MLWATSAHGREVRGNVGAGTVRVRRATGKFSRLRGRADLQMVGDEKLAKD
jgi:hypothetical protein